MFTTMSVQLPTHILLDLIEQLKRRQTSQDLSEVIAQAVEYWLLDQKQLSTTMDPGSLRGYQWKCLFLPEGTVLRSWSYGEHNYARVVGDKIIHKGSAVSPNQFARSFARTTRNAWEDLYIRRPSDKQFKLACVLRREVLLEQDQARAAAVQATTQAVAPISAALVPASVMEAPQTVVPVTATARATTPGEDWTLPERRKWRLRLEDIAFD